MAVAGAPDASCPCGATTALTALFTAQHPLPPGCPVLAAGMGTGRGRPLGPAAAAAVSESRGGPWGAAAAAVHVGCGLSTVGALIGVSVPGSAASLWIIPTSCRPEPPADQDKAGTSDQLDTEG